MDLDRFKIYLQNYLAEGLMLVVGSGLSCSEGLPGMFQWEAAIDPAVNESGSAPHIGEWNSIRALIAPLGLEGALKHAPPSVGTVTTLTDAEAAARANLESDAFVRNLG